MRESLGRSIHDKKSETRQMAEADQPVQQKAGSYALVIAVLFVLIAVLIIVTR